MGQWHSVLGRLLVLALFASASGGCLQAQRNRQTFVPPAPGTVPSELSKVMLPEYVIEPPDVLRIQAIIRQPKAYEKVKDADGKDTPEDDLTKPKKDASGKVVYSDRSDDLRSTPLYNVSDNYTVRPDGTVYLGPYGSIPVAGLTVSQAAQAVRDRLATQVRAESGGTDPRALAVILDVTNYLSKRIYVIFDGGGQGEQVVPIPVTGSETVLDAIATLGGLPPVASKRNVWVARRTPHAGHPEQILPVDWVGITQHGVSATNYQLMPGDRVYVKALRAVTFDTAMQRTFAPIERILGYTLLGASTANQISGRGNGFNR